MALRTPWDSTVEGVQRASTIRPEPPARTPFSPVVEHLAPGPNDPRFHGNGRYGGTPNPPNPALRPAAAAPTPGVTAAAAEAPTAAATKNGGWFRRTAETLRPTSYGVGKAAGVVVGKLGPAAAGADVVSHFNDYKINDPSVDSSATGTFNALRQGDFRGAGRSVSKGALEAGMDLGSVAANVADLFVPGKAPVSTAYNQMLRSKFGDQLVDNTGGTQPAAPAVPTQTAAAVSVDPRTATSWGSRPGVSTAAPPAEGTVHHVGNSFSGDNVKAGFGYTGAGRPGGLTEEQGGGGLRGGGTVSSLETIGVDGYQRQLANIRSLGDGPNAAATGIGHVGGTESFGKSLSVLGPSGSQRPRDVRAANALRSAEDIAQMRERGETVRAGASQNNSLRIAEMNNATARRSNDQNNSTSLRGQNMDFEGRMMPARLLAQQRAAHADVYGSVGAGDGAPNVDQHMKAAALFDRMGLKEQAVEARAAAAAMQTVQGNQDTQSAARAADTEKVFRPMFTREVKDAQGNVKQEFDDVAAAKAAATVRGIYGEKFDSLTPAQKRSAYTEIAAKQKNQEAERQVMPSIGDAALDLVGLYDKPAEVSAPRDISGGKVERAGLISRRGVDRNSTLLRMPNGQTINYGVVDAPQLEDIQRRLRN